MYRVRYLSLFSKELKKKKKRIMMNPHLYHIFYFHIQTKVKYFYLDAPNKVAKTEGTIVQSLCLPSTNRPNTKFVSWKYQDFKNSSTADHFRFSSSLLLRFIEVFF